MGLAPGWLESGQGCDLAAGPVCFSGRWRREVRIKKGSHRWQGETWYYGPCGKRMKQFPEVIKVMKLSWAFLEKHILPFWAQWQHAGIVCSGSCSCAIAGQRHDRAMTLLMPYCLLLVPEPQCGTRCSPRALQLQSSYACWRFLWRERHTRGADPSVKYAFVPEKGLVDKLQLPLVGFGGLGALNCWEGQVACTVAFHCNKIFLVILGLAMGTTVGRGDPI